MFRQFPVFKVLPNLRNQMSLICLLLPIFKNYQPKRGFRFILVNMHVMKNTNYEAPFYVISSVLLLSRVYTFASWLARVKCRGCARRNFMQVEILICRIPHNLHETFARATPGLDLREPTFVV
jgi:hypothetical protein